MNSLDAAQFERLTADDPDPACAECGADWELELTDTGHDCHGYLCCVCRAEQELSECAACGASWPDDMIVTVGSVHGECNACPDCRRSA